MFREYNLVKKSDTAASAAAVMGGSRIITDGNVVKIGSFLPLGYHLSAVNAW